MGVYANIPLPYIIMHIKDFYGKRFVEQELLNVSEDGIASENN